MSTVSDDKVLRNIARNVARLRGDRSLHSLAKAAGSYAINISRIESEETMPSAALLSRVANALKVSVDTLLADPPKKSRK